MSKVVLQISSIVCQLLIIRALKVEEYGALGVLANFVTILSAISVSPLSGVLSRYLPEYLISDQFFKLKKLISYSVIILALLLLVLISILSCFSTWILDFLNVAFLNEFAFLVILYVVTNIFNLFVSAIMTSQMLHDKIAKVSIWQAIIMIVSYFSLLPWLSLEYVLWVMVCNQLLFSFAGVFYSVKPLMVTARKFKLAPIFEQNSFRRELSYGFYSMGNEIGSVAIGKSSDLLIVSMVLSPLQAGFMAVAHKIYDLFLKVFPLKELNTVFRTLLVQRFYSPESRDEFNDVLSLISRLFLPVFLIPFILIALFGREFLALFAGQNYVDSYYIMVCVFASGIVTAIFYPVGLAAIVLERLDLAMYCKFTGVVFIPLSILTAEEYGAVGVACITLLGDFSRNYLLYLLLGKRYGVTVEVGKTLKSALPLIILLGVTSTVLNFLSPNENWQLIIVFLIICALICIALLYFHPFSKRELKFLSDVLAASSKGSQIVDKIILAHSVCNKCIRIFRV